MVTLFFLTLNFNNKVLYTPSDFREDESFLRTLTPQERRIKLETEAKELQALPPSDDDEHPLPVTPKETEQFIEIYTQAEELVLRDLETEYGRHLKRNVAMDNFMASPAGLRKLDRDEVFVRSWKFPNDQIREWRLGSKVCAELLVPHIHRVQQRLIAG